MLSGLLLGIDNEANTYITSGYSETKKFLLSFFHYRASVNRFSCQLFEKEFLRAIEPFFREKQE